MQMVIGDRVAGMYKQARHNIIHNIAFFSCWLLHPFLVFPGISYHFLAILHSSWKKFYWVHKFTSDWAWLPFSRLVSCNSLTQMVFHQFLLSNTVPIQVCVITPFSHTLSTMQEDPPCPESSDQSLPASLWDRVLVSLSFLCSSRRKETSVLRDQCWEMLSVTLEQVHLSSTDLVSLYKLNRSLFNLLFTNL